MVKKIGPTKLPTRTVVADDLVIEVDGSEYRPHAGESVVLRAGGGTVADSMLELRSAQLQVEVQEMAEAVQSAGEDEPGTDIARQFLARTDEMQRVVGESLGRLASRIVSWTWTDPDGKPYPSPPTPEVLMTLEREEIAWLRGQFSSQGVAEKKGSTASTKRS